MSAFLHPSLRNKLLRACARMGSEQDHHRAEGALQATRILQSVGLVWSDVIRGPAGSKRRRHPTAPQQAVAAHTRRKHQEAGA